jgi:tetratricopeptide (TPR) repeat protein
MSSDSTDQKHKTFFQYGNDAAMKGNLDYAIDMYRQACKLMPENMVYRQSLRACEKRKFNNEPGKVGMMASARNQPILMRARSARGKSNWAQSLDICEEAFMNNPWDFGATRVAAEAAEGMGLLSLAQWYVETVQSISKDVDFLKFSAHIHELNESWQKAINCWEQVKKLSPNDQDANRQINALSAAGTIKRAGLDDALDKRAHAATASAAAESMEDQLNRLKQEQLTPEQRLIKQIQTDPGAVHSYIELAELCRNRGELDKAEKILAKGIKANPTDQGLLSIYEDTQIGRLKKAVDAQSQRVLQYPDETEAKAKLDQLTAMLSKYQIEAYRRRISLHPEDASLHFQLGLILAKNGDHDGAITEFQQARTSPTLKVQALYQAGLSFEANNALKLADRSYREALKAIDPAEDKENFLALNYRLGRVAQGLGNDETAAEHYNEVAAVDYGYLDVAKRLRDL